ncbi:MAG: magnesium/cobalt transporter CorA [Candidatus Omnitrophica bacterium]|nr:magnesium/cobalt transporter CorA [Candidatus Omnitrophota bacterium]
MIRPFRMRKKDIGAFPGELIYEGDSSAKKTKITVFDYDQNTFSEQEVTPEECFQFKNKPTITWLNIDGIHDIPLMEKIGRHFEIHSLTLEDILNTQQRAKIEVYENYVFIVVKMLKYDHDTAKVDIEQVSLILTENCVISFQEKEGDVFTPIRDRIRQGKGRVRRMKADYLAYSLLDAIVDNYFLILEAISEALGKREEELTDNPSYEILHAIHKLRSEIIYLRKAVWPLRDVTANLDRGEIELIGDDTRVFLRDLYDHTIQVIDSVETFRDMSSGLLDLYLSSISNRMNEIMKVLTLTASIFIPISFIAGLYGMNFNPAASKWSMPELNTPYGYVMVLGVMLSIVIGMLIFFKRKKWL